MRLIDRFRSLVNSLGRKLGPGLITGASDNDPAGISTYSIAGATTGYSLLWLALITVPMMIAIQSMAARIGAVKGRGLGAVIGRYYGRKVLVPVNLIVITVNVATLGAELEGVSAALELLTGLPRQWFLLPVAGAILATEIFWSYERLANYLKWLTLVLFAYIGAGLLAEPNWGEALRSTFIPTLSLDSRYLLAMVGVLGTTVSPYMFFWIASEEVEEIEEKEATGQPPIEEAGEEAETTRLFDVISGTMVANVVFYFVILSSAATLAATGQMIDTAAEAAEALRPIAGDLSYILFSLGIIGGGLIAIPVLAGATAYPVAELFGWKEGLHNKPWEAPGFYSIMVLAVLGGLAIEVTGISPIQALFYSSVLQGFLAPVLVALITLISSSPEAIAPGKASNWFEKTFGWLTVVLMSLGAGLLVWSMVTSLFAG